MAITINSSDIYNSQAVQLPTTGVVVEYRYTALSDSTSVRVELYFYASAFAKNNNFSRIRDLLYAPSPPAFVVLNRVFTETLTAGAFDTFTATDVESYIQTYIESVLGASTVTIT